MSSDARRLGTVQTIVEQQVITIHNLFKAKGETQQRGRLSGVTLVLMICEDISAASYDPRLLLCYDDGGSGAKDLTQDDQLVYLQLRYYYLPLRQV